MDDKKNALKVFETNIEMKPVELEFNRFSVLAAQLVYFEEANIAIPSLKFKELIISRMQELDVLSEHLILCLQTGELMSHLQSKSIIKMESKKAILKRLIINLPVEEIDFNN